jgi:hypothetical protein
MCNAAVIVCSSLTACYCTGKMLAQARALKTLQICVFTLPPFKFACLPCHPSNLRVWLARTLASFCCWIDGPEYDPIFSSLPSGRITGQCAASSSQYPAFTPSS